MTSRKELCLCFVADQDPLHRDAEIQSNTLALTCSVQCSIHLSELEVARTVTCTLCISNSFF